MDKKCQSEGRLKIAGTTWKMAVLELAKSGNSSSGALMTWKQSKFTFFFVRKAIAVQNYNQTSINSHKSSARLQNCHFQILPAPELPFSRFCLLSLNGLHSGIFCPIILIFFTCATLTLGFDRQDTP